MADETGRRLKAHKNLITAYLSAKNINARAVLSQEGGSDQTK